jgi:hypothetical protein
MLVRSAGASNATLLLLTTDPLQVLALPPLRSDPLSRTDWGSRHLEELRALPEPRLEEAVESPDLTDALRAGEPSFDAVAAVPLRSAERVLALALLYYVPHVVLPTREALLHLGFLARVLAGPLEAAAAREAESGARRLRALSRATAAAVTSLVARLDSGAARLRSVDLADVLAPLGAPGVSIEVEAGTPPVVGDAPLLRFALATLMLRCEALALERGQRPRIAVRAGREGALVRVQVRGAGDAVGSGPAPADDADAEISVVQAIVDLHGGAFTASARGQESRFTIDLKPAP